MRADHAWVFQALLSVGISLRKILDTYNRWVGGLTIIPVLSLLYPKRHTGFQLRPIRLYLANEPVWLTRGAPNHLLYVLAKILDSFANSPSIVPYSERYVASIQVLLNCELRAVNP